MRTTPILTGVAAAILNYSGYVSSHSASHDMLIGMGITLLTGILVGGLTWSLMRARHLTERVFTHDRQAILGKQSYLNFEMRQSMHSMVCVLGTVPNVDSRIWDAMHQLDSRIKEHAQLNEWSVARPLLPPAQQHSWATSAVARLFAHKGVI